MSVADEDVILEARKLVPKLKRHITWSAAEKVWIATAASIPEISARGTSAAEAATQMDSLLLGHLIEMRERGEKWPYS